MSSEQQRPLVSVVVPVYNRAEIIGQTIDSVLAQSEQDFELIIVDDYSDDGEALQRLVQQYADARIRLLRHPENRHGAAARNTGILAAEGSYIALLDSDDLWVEDKLSRCLQVHSGKRDVVYSQLRQGNDIFPDCPIGEGESVGDYLIISRGAMQTSTLFMSSELAREVQFDAALERFQDYDFVVRLEQAQARFIYIEEALVEMLDDDRLNRISSQTDYRPAIFWLGRTTGLSGRARAEFYLRRVVRLMAIGGDSDKIFSLMPPGVYSQLGLAQRAYLHALRCLPGWVVPWVRKLYQRLKY